MPTDYVLFNHGVSTREARPQPTYADSLFDLIQSNYRSSSGRTLKKIVLYWGDISAAEEERLLTIYRSSPYWNQMWFRSIRETIILQSVGDVALYLSRYIGAKVADRLQEQTLAGLASFNPEEDRLHLVSHSLGTAILFDILFSARWDAPNSSGHTSVETLRNLLFGLGPTPKTGIVVGSVTTMGSPLGLFSLIDVDQSTENKTDSSGHLLSSYDITPRLAKLLMNLRNELGMKLPWYNFMHPGDPIATPLAQLLPELVDRDQQYINIQDVLIPPMGLTEDLVNLVSQWPPSILVGLQTHNEYFERNDVAQRIAQAIENASYPLAVATDLH
ncbi:MAG: hypothetical protein H0U76_19810 [Ktedonobacteraceae bacterium]|nr:hypothetical protein [Ktedonobacteraceae bacterium]